MVYHPLMGYLILKYDTNNLYTVIWYQVFLSNINTFQQTYLTLRRDSNKCYHSRLKWTWERWQWKGIQHSPKFQYYWSLTIRLFSAISRTLLWMWGITPLKRCSWCILQPQRTRLKGYRIWFPTCTPGCGELIYHLCTL